MVSDEKHFGAASCSRAHSRAWWKREMVHCPAPYTQVQTTFDGLVAMGPSVRQERPRNRGVPTGQRS